MEKNNKKTYEKPFAEKIEFDYRNQVVASAHGSDCIEYWSQKAGLGCMQNHKWDN